MTLIFPLTDVIGHFIYSTQYVVWHETAAAFLSHIWNPFLHKYDNHLYSLFRLPLKHQKKSNKKSHQHSWCFSMKYGKYNIEIENSTVAIILRLYAAAACVCLVKAALFCSCDRAQFIASVWNCGGRKFTPTSLTDGPLNLFLLSAKSAWRGAPRVCIQTCLMLQDNAATLQLKRKSKKRRI